MTHNQLILMLATVRLGGVRAILVADCLVDTPSNLRPAVLAKSLAAGKNDDMSKLITAAQITKRITEMAKERN